MESGIKIRSTSQVEKNWAWAIWPSTSAAEVYTRSGARYRRLMPARPEVDLSRYLLSPMPGLLVSLAVEEGQEIKAGEVVAVIEAMKMENTLRADKDCVVEKIHVRPGETVERDQAIVEFAD